MSGLSPARLTHKELVHYAYLKNNNGLDKEWAEALIKALEAYVDLKKFEPSAPMKVAPFKESDFPDDYEV